MVSKKGMSATNIQYKDKYNNIHMLKHNKHSGVCGVMAIKSALIKIGSRSNKYELN